MCFIIKIYVLAGCNQDRQLLVFVFLAQPDLRGTHTKIISMFFCIHIMFSISRCCVGFSCCLAKWG